MYSFCELLLLILQSKYYTFLCVCSTDGVSKAEDGGKDAEKEKVKNGDGEKEASENKDNEVSVSLCNKLPGSLLNVQRFNHVTFFIKRSLPFRMKMKLPLLLKRKYKTKRRRKRRLNLLQRQIRLMGIQLRKKRRKGSLEKLMRRPKTPSPKDLRLRRKLQTTKVNRNDMHKPLNFNNVESQG